MKTKGEYIDDIELRINPEISDDYGTLEREHIGHLLEVSRDALVTRKLNAEVAAFIDPDNFYLEDADGLSLTFDGKANSDVRTYFCAKATLPQQPLSLIKDRGIVRVATGSGEIIDLVSKREADSLIRLPAMGRVGPNSLIATRSGSVLSIYGITKAASEDTKIDVSYVRSYDDPIGTLGESDDFVVDGDVAKDMLDDVENTCRRQIEGKPRTDDNNNDGTEEQ